MSHNLDPRVSRYGADLFQVGKVLRDFGPHRLDRIVDRLDIPVTRVKRALRELRKEKLVRRDKGCPGLEIYQWIDPR